MNPSPAARLLGLALVAGLAGCATSTRTEVMSSADSAVLEGADWRLVANFWLRSGNTASSNNFESFIEST